MSAPPTPQGGSEIEPAGNGAPGDETGSEQKQDEVSTGMSVAPVIKQKEKQGAMRTLQAKNMKSLRDQKEQAWKTGGKKKELIELAESIMTRQIVPNLNWKVLLQTAGPKVKESVETNLISQLKKVRDRKIQIQRRKDVQDAVELMVGVVFADLTESLKKDGKSDEKKAMDEAFKAMHLKLEAITKQQTNEREAERAAAIAGEAKPKKRTKRLRSIDDITKTIDQIFGTGPQLIPTPQNILESEGENSQDDTSNPDAQEILSLGDLLPFWQDSVQEMVESRVSAMKLEMEEMKEQFQQDMKALKRKVDLPEDERVDEDDFEEADISAHRKLWLQRHGPMAIDEFKEAFLSITWEGLSRNTYGFFIHSILLCGSVFKDQPVPETASLIFTSVIGVCMSVVIQWVLAWYLYKSIPEYSSINYATPNDVCRTQSFVQIVCVGLFLFNVLNNVPGIMKNLLIIGFSTRFISEDEDGITKVHHWRQSDSGRELVDISEMYKIPTFFVPLSEIVDKDTRHPALKSLFVEKKKKLWEQFVVLIGFDYICGVKCLKTTVTTAAGHGADAPNHMTSFRELTTHIPRDMLEVWELREFLTQRLVALDPTFEDEAHGKIMETIQRKLVVMDFLRPSWVQPLAYHAWKGQQSLFDHLPLTSRRVLKEMNKKLLKLFQQKSTDSTTGDSKTNTASKCNLSPSLSGQAKPLDPKTLQGVHFVSALSALESLLPVALEEAPKSSGKETEGGKAQDALKETGKAAEVDEAQDASKETSKVIEGDKAQDASRASGKAAGEAEAQDASKERGKVSGGAEAKEVSKESGSVKGARFMQVPHYPRSGGYASVLEALNEQSQMAFNPRVQAFVEHSLSGAEKNETMWGLICSKAVAIVESMEMLYWRVKRGREAKVLEMYDREYKLSISSHDEGEGERRILEGLVREQIAGTSLEGLGSVSTATSRHVLLDNSDEIVDTALARERMQSYPARMRRFRLAAFLLGVLPELLTLSMIVGAGIKYIMWSGTKMGSNTTGMEEIILATLAICFIYDIDEQIYESVVPRFHQEAHEGDLFDVRFWVTHRSASLTRRPMFSFWYNWNLTGRYVTDLTRCGFGSQAVTQGPGGSKAEAKGLSAQNQQAQDRSAQPAGASAQKAAKVTPLPDNEQLDEVTVDQDSSEYWTTLRNEDKLEKWALESMVPERDRDKVIYESLIPEFSKPRDSADCGGPGEAVNPSSAALKQVSGIVRLLVLKLFKLVSDSEPTGEAGTHAQESSDQAKRETENKANFYLRVDSVVVSQSSTATPAISPASQGFVDQTSMVASNTGGSAGSSTASTRFMTMRQRRLNLDLALYPKTPQQLLGVKWNDYVEAKVVTYPARMNGMRLASSSRPFVVHVKQRLLVSAYSGSKVGDEVKPGNSRSEKTGITDNDVYVEEGRGYMCETAEELNEAYDKLTTAQGGAEGGKFVLVAMPAAGPGIFVRSKAEVTQKLITNLNGLLPEDGGIVGLLPEFGGSVCLVEMKRVAGTASMGRLRGIARDGMGFRCSSLADVHDAVRLVTTADKGPKAVAVLRRPWIDGSPPRYPSFVTMDDLDKPGKMDKMKIPKDGWVLIEEATPWAGPRQVERQSIVKTDTGKGSGEGSEVAAVNKGGPVNIAPAGAATEAAAAGAAPANSNSVGPGETETAGAAKVSLGFPAPAAGAFGTVDLHTAFGSYGGDGGDGGGDAVSGFECESEDELLVAYRLIGSSCVALTRLAARSTDQRTANSSPELIQSVEGLKNLKYWEEPGVRVLMTGHKEPEQAVGGVELGVNEGEARPSPEETGVQNSNTTRKKLEQPVEGMESGAAKGKDSDTSHGIEEAASTGKSKELHIPAEFDLSASEIHDSLIEMFCPGFSLFLRMEPCSTDRTVAAASNSGDTTVPGGLQTQIEVTNSVRVRDVDPTSVDADVTIQRGDVLVAVDDVEVAGLLLPVVIAHLHSIFGNPSQVRSLRFRRPFALPEPGQESAVLADLTDTTATEKSKFQPKRSRRHDKKLGTGEYVVTMKRCFVPRSADVEEDPADAYGGGGGGRGGGGRRRWGLGAGRLRRRRRGAWEVAEDLLADVSAAVRLHWRWMDALTALRGRLLRGVVCSDMKMATLMSTDDLVAMSGDDERLNDFALARNYPFLYARKVAFYLSTHWLESLQATYTAVGAHYFVLVIIAILVVGYGFRAPAQCNLFAPPGWGNGRFPTFWATQPWPQTCLTQLTDSSAMTFDDLYAPDPSGTLRPRDADRFVSGPCGSSYYVPDTDEWSRFKAGGWAAAPPDNSDS